jgi:hypothetical protein
MKISGFPTITPVTRVDWTRRRHRTDRPVLFITRRRRRSHRWW